MRINLLHQEIYQKIETVIAHKKKQKEPLIAAFDADGTLWNLDLGEVFFQYLIRHQKVALPPNPWKHYHDWKKTDLNAAYLWLAQILKGVSLPQVRTWAEEAFLEVKPFPYFPEIQELIAFLIQERAQVYVVTASVKWAVEPGAFSLGIPFENVLGVETEVHKNMVTENQKGVITSREGKRLSLLSQTKTQPPFLSVGNSMGDLELLRTSTDLKIAIQSAPKDHELFETESQLQEIAQKEKWVRLILK